MEKEEIYNQISGQKYHSVDDLRYNRLVGLLLSKEQFADYLDVKDELVNEKRDNIRRVDLKTFNSRFCFYVNGSHLAQLRNEYERILNSDYELNQCSMFSRNAKDVLYSCLFSEVEGTLGIENVPTTQRRIAEISRIDDPEDVNDRIIKNMLNAIGYIVNEKPAFNRENLFRLYSILSRRSLPPDSALKDGSCYRDTPVFIGSYEGADYRRIDEYMNSLFDFANDPENLRRHGIMLPFICQYYILYVHPYNDFNGRTARMVSFWLTYINDIAIAPYFINEAINEYKNGYYKALVNTRETRNDLTYFLSYILESSIRFSFVYKNQEHIRSVLYSHGDTLTPGEWVYVKKILIHNPSDFFTWKLFLGYINTQMTKQGAYKILNTLTAANILHKSTNSRGDTVFRLNQDLVMYRYN